MAIAEKDLAKHAPMMQQYSTTNYLISKFKCLTLWKNTMLHTCYKNPEAHCGKMRHPDPEKSLKQVAMSFQPV